MDSTVRGVEEQVRSLAAGAARSEGAELVDLELQREPAGWVLRLFIDKPGGVSVEDCQRVSQHVGTILEVEDPIPHAYTLEVSSPGLTRSLRRPEDWAGAVGSLVKLVTHEPVDRRQSFLGRVVAVEESSVRIESDGSEYEIPRDQIARARLEIDWPKPGKPGSPSRGRRGKKR